MITSPKLIVLNLRTNNTTTATSHKVLLQLTITFFFKKDTSTLLLNMSISLQYADNFSNYDKLGDYLSSFSNLQEAICKRLRILLLAVTQLGNITIYIYQLVWLPKQTCVSFNQIGRQSFRKVEAVTQENNSLQIHSK